MSRCPAVAATFLALLMVVGSASASPRGGNGPMPELRGGNGPMPERGGNGPMPERGGNGPMPELRGGNGPMPEAK
jgi:hypothetical protein